jgi:hypothetical protein
MSMRNILPVLAVIAGAILLASASGPEIAPALAQALVKDGKSDAKKSAVSKGPSKSTLSKAPSTTYKVVKTPSTASKAPSAFAKKAPSAFAKKAPPVIAKKAPPVIVKKAPPAAKKPPVYAKKPPTIVKKPPVVVYHRPWRPGLRWRWIVVPAIIIAQNLEWCHYHLYPIAGVRFHRGIECHEHAWWVPWDHPSIRYVEAY